MKLRSICFQIGLIGLALLVVFGIPAGAVADANPPPTATNTLEPTITPLPTQTPTLTPEPTITNTPWPTAEPYIPPAPSQTPDPYFGLAGADLDEAPAGELSPLDIFLIICIILALAFLVALGVSWFRQRTYPAAD